MVNLGNIMTTELIIEHENELKKSIFLKRIKHFKTSILIKKHISYLIPISKNKIYAKMAAAYVKLSSC